MNKTNSFSATGQSAQLTMGILLEKKFLNHSLVRIRLSNVQLVKSIHPGQFINIKVTDSFFPLLRRPFSVHRINREQGWFEILFKIIGTGTKLLAGFQPGAKLDFIAPLGNSFIVSEKLD